MIFHNQSLGLYCLAAVDVKLVKSSLGVQCACDCIKTWTDYLELYTIDGLISATDLYMTSSHCENKKIKYKCCKAPMV